MKHRLFTSHTKSLPVPHQHANTLDNLTALKYYEHLAFPFVRNPCPHNSSRLSGLCTYPGQLSTFAQLSFCGTFSHSLFHLSAVCPHACIRGAHSGIVEFHGDTRNATLYTWSHAVHAPCGHHIVMQCQECKSLNSFEVYKCPFTQEYSLPSNADLQNLSTTAPIMWLTG